MNKIKTLELEALVLARLKGKMTLLAPQEDREAVVASALEGVLKEDHPD